MSKFYKYIALGISVLGFICLFLPYVIRESITGSQFSDSFSGLFTTFGGEYRDITNQLIKLDFNFFSVFGVLLMVVGGVVCFFIDNMKGKITSSICFALSGLLSIFTVQIFMSENGLTGHTMLLYYYSGYGSILETIFRFVGFAFMVFVICISPSNSKKFRGSRK